MFDLFIIGGGPAGYTAAFVAAAKGLKVALAEEREIGGTCLNRGCIPTKALLHAGEIRQSIKDSQTIGIKANETSVDSSTLQSHKDEIIEKLRNGLLQQVKANKVTLFTGKAYIKEDNTVTVNGEDYKAENIIVATGTVPALPPIKGIELALTSDDVLKEIKPLKKLLIIGGGVIGVEMAQLYHDLFDTEITIVEAMDSLLPLMDKELGRSLAQLFKQKGFSIITGAFCQSIEKTDAGLTVTLTKNEQLQTLETEAVLVATGRKALSDIFNGHKPGVNKGRLVINEHFETSLPNVYAIGDVADGYPQLAHAASAMAEELIGWLTEGKEVRDLKLIPSCVYVNPEIASVGLTEKELENAITGKATTLANGRSVISGAPRGFIIVIADNTGVIKGCQMMCERASDMIMEMSVAIHEKMTVSEMLKVIHGHPTYSEAIVTALEALKKKL